MATFRVSALYTAMLIAAHTGAAASTLFLNGGASSISIFDSVSLTEKAYVAGPRLARSAALSPDGKKAYIATGGILVVNVLTRSITGRLPSDNAMLLRLSPDGSRLYAANVNGSVWVYDTASGSVVKRIPFLVKDAYAYAVSALTVSSDGALIAMGSVESLCGEFGCPPTDPPALITEIDGQTGSLLRRLPLPYVVSLAISGDNHAIYAANLSAIAKLDASTGQSLGTIDFAADTLAVDVEAGRLFAGTGGAGTAGAFTLGVFSTADDSPLAQVTLTGPVEALAWTPDHATVFAGGCLSNGQEPVSCPVAAVATATWQAQASGSLSGYPADFAVSPFGNRLWVANGSPSELTAVNTETNRVSGAAEAAFRPDATIVPPSGGKIYIADGDASISVIDGQTLARIKTLQTSGTSFNEVGGSCVSPDGQRAYIALNRLKVLDTSIDQITGEIPELPIGCAVSPDSSIVYTTNAEYDEPTNLYRIFVSSYAAATLSPISTSNFLSEQLPLKIFVSPNGNKLYVITYFAALAIDPATLEIQRKIGLSLCSDSAFSADGKTLYCLVQPADTLQPDTIQAIQIATGTVTRTYSAGISGFGKVALTPDGKKIYVSLQAPTIVPSGVLEQIDLATGSVRLANTTLFGAIAIQ